MGVTGLATASALGALALRLWPRREGDEPGDTDEPALSSAR
jgi:hypothetical protein